MLAKAWDRYRLDMVHHRSVLKRGIGGENGPHA